ncbi:MAG: type 1 glutamine amidotransferase [Jatrophihabitans sp.]|uniref:type 1 glutamine amidotransferase n=1 Tax=Jatrophihabitans sp. TaxID=1932789 RepID=UPI003F7D1E2C
MRVLVVENAPSDPVGRLGEWLTGAGLELDVRTPSTLPTDLDEHAGLVVLGMPGSAHDAQYRAVLDLLRAAVAAERPTLGICGGAQLLAVAHGGRVEPNPEGPELGAHLVAKRSAAAGDPLFGPLPITPDVIQWHWDAITELPPGARQLASSPFTEHQAFRLGRLAWGIQFHIETPPEVVRAWAAQDAPRLAEHDLGTILARVEAADADVVEVWQPFAVAFADVVRAPQSVVAPRGAATTTAGPITDPAAIRAALAAEAAAAHGSRAAVSQPMPLPLPTLRPGPPSERG